VSQQYFPSTISSRPSYPFSTNVVITASTERLHPSTTTSSRAPDEFQNSIVIDPLTTSATTKVILTTTEFDLNEGFFAGFGFEESSDEEDATKRGGGKSSSELSILRSTPVQEDVIQLNPVILNNSKSLLIRECNESGPTNISIRFSANPNSQTSVTWSIFTGNDTFVPLDDQYDVTTKTIDVRKITDFIWVLSQSV